MAQFRTCPDCGANLDPGERCDCKDTQSFIPILTGSLQYSKPEILDHGVIRYPEHYPCKIEGGRGCTR